LDYRNHTKGEIKDEVIEKNEFADLAKKNEFAIHKKDPVLSQYIEKKKK